MIVLDTNVLSELMRPSPSGVVTGWLEQHSIAQLAVTAITVAEIFYGLELLPGGKRRTHLIAAAEILFEKRFRRVLPFDGPAARTYSHMAAARRPSGKPISQEDAQIAAIVRIHSAILATRNDKDFQGCGIPIVNPWNPA